MVVTPPALLDGVEVFNASPSHAAFRGEIAKLWAEHYNLIQTSGSDLHSPNAKQIAGGIETDEPITTNAQLVEVLKSRNYRILQDTSHMKDDREPV
jgi:hypothetical protein